jgi:ATP-binding cassette subfamily B protein
VAHQSRALTVALGVLTLIAGVLPAGVAYVGSLIVDAVVAAMRTRRQRAPRG